MNVHKALMPIPLEQQAVPVPKRSTLEDAAWSPVGNASSPAHVLQQRLHTAMARQGSYAEEEISLAERMIRSTSRAAGFVALAGAVGLIGWLII